MIQAHRLPSVAVIIQVLEQPQGLTRISQIWRKMKMEKLFLLTMNLRLMLKKYLKYILDTLNLKISSASQRLYTAKLSWKKRWNKNKLLKLPKIKLQKKQLKKLWKKKKLFMCIYLLLLTPNKKKKNLKQRKQHLSQLRSAIIWLDLKLGL